jgi:hypothetical protein
MKFSILIIIPLFISCQSTDKENEKSVIDLHEFFYNFDDYSTPQVLVYEVDSSGVKSNIYYVAAQMDSDKLKLIRFDKNLNRQAVIIDKFDNKGVELIESYSTDNNDSIYSVSEITEGTIFQYITEGSVGNLNVTVSGKDEGEVWKRISLTKWFVVDTTELEIENQKVKTYICKGTEEVEFSIGGQTYSDIIKTETWYSKGIGLSKLVYKFPSGEYSETFIKTITVEEFEELKK